MFMWIGTELVMIVDNLNTNTSHGGFAKNMFSEIIFIIIPVTLHGREFK